MSTTRRAVAPGVTTVAQVERLDVPALLSSNGEQSVQRKRTAGVMGANSVALQGFDGESRPLVMGLVRRVVFVVAEVGADDDEGVVGL